MRVNRNHFGRQAESFQAPLNLPFLGTSDAKNTPFNAVFIRAPVVEKLLPLREGIQADEQGEGSVIAPSRHHNLAPEEMQVEVLATLPGRAARLANKGIEIATDKEAGDIVAVRQGNVFGTSFHPELTQDARIHSWWLDQVQDAVRRRRTQQ